MSIPEVALRCTGKTVPLVGMGTAVYPFAALYQSEEPLGEATKKALELGLIKSSA